MRPVMPPQTSSLLATQKPGQSAAIVHPMAVWSGVLTHKGRSLGQAARPLLPHLTGGPYTEQSCVDVSDL